MANPETTTWATWRDFLVRRFWSIRYALYSKDLYPGIRAGRGSKDNPLTMDDMEPVFRMMRRLRPPASLQDWRDKTRQTDNQPESL